MEQNTKPQVEKIESNILFRVKDVTNLDGGKLLQIIDVQENDIGRYYCIVSTSVDKVVSNMADLNIEEVKSDCNLLT